MARTFTTEQQALLRSSHIQARLLTTWYMDDGEYRFCDDVYDLTYNGYTWIGANAIAECTDIKANSQGFAAESVTISIDGTRLYEAGVSDPAEFFQLIFGLALTNRRVDIELGLMGSDDVNPTLVIPLYAGKINYPRLVDPQMALGGTDSPHPRLEIVLDSLAARYQWVTGRTRSHEDQLEIDPTDQFYSFVFDNLRAEQTIYWGKKAPEGISAGLVNNLNANASIYAISNPSGHI